jgi:hypothetical protein
MARENSLWGVERIRGELMKLGIHLARATVKKYPGLLAIMDKDGLTG